MTEYAPRAESLIGLVNEAAGSDIVIEVLSRADELGPVGVSTSVPIGRSTYTVSGPTRVKVLRVQLVMGDYRAILTGVGGLWTAAADDLARQIRRWIEVNRAAIIERRGSGKQ